MTGGTDVFLATTALEPFWDTALPVVFLDEGCTRYSRRAHWIPLRLATLPEPVPDARLHDRIASLERLHENVLPHLAQFLNEAHGSRLSTDEWRLLLSPWLTHFLHILADRYARLSAALAAYPRLTTLVLDERSYVTPHDTLEFVGLAKSDGYNLQLYSMLLSLMGRRFPARPYSISIEGNHDRVFSRGFAHRFIARLAAVISRITFPRDAIGICRAYIPRSVMLRLMLRLSGDCWPLMTVPLRPATAIDATLRQRLAAVLPGSIEMERLVFPMIARCLPSCYLEGYASVGAAAMRWRIRRPRALLSAVGWHFDEVFKQVAVLSAGAGVPRIGVQHGGNYGSLAYLLQEKHELSVVHRFFSWGWRDHERSDVVRPLPAAKLLARHAPVVDPMASTDILLVANTWFRYLLQYPVTVGYWASCIARQERFLRALGPQMRRVLAIRAHREDGGWDYAERWRDSAPEARREDWRIPFAHRVRSCRLYVCDHVCYSTTFIEALVHGVPAILLRDPHVAADRLHDRALPVWNGLRAAGILFDDPEAAARQVAAVYDRAAAWWAEPDRRAAVAAFLEQFGWTSEDAVAQWSRELRDLSAGQGEGRA